jgi:hypothetical protein
MTGTESFMQIRLVGIEQAGARSAVAEHFLHVAGAREPPHGLPVQPGSLPIAAIVAPRRRNSRTAA